MRLLVKFMILIVAAALLGSIGCASVPYDKMSAQEIFALGTQKMEKRKFDAAKEAFEKVKELYPFSTQVALAEVRLADCHYLKREWEEAVTAYNEFLLRHPTHQEVPHALYFLGMSYFSRMLSIDRDQTFALEAEKQLQRVVVQYPSSEYYADAKKKLDETRKKLAKRERYVGHFYYINREYYAALCRYNAVLDNYKDTEYYEEALYYAAKCSSNLKARPEAVRLFKLLLETYPNSKWASQARSSLAKLSPSDLPAPVAPEPAKP